MKEPSKPQGIDQSMGKSATVIDEGKEEVIEQTNWK